MSTEFLSIDQLQRALAIEEKIAVLQDELRAVIGETGTVAPLTASASSTSKKDGRSGKRSAATRAKMAAAQQARWAKKNGATASAGIEAAKPVKAKKKRTMSPEGRARIAAAARKRWAKVKAGK